MPVHDCELSIEYIYAAWYKSAALCSMSVLCVTEIDTLSDGSGYTMVVR